MKTSKGSIRTARIRIVGGWILAVCGAFVLVILNYFYGYNNTTLWVVGLGLILLAALISKSRAILAFITDIR